MSNIENIWKYNARGYTIFMRTYSRPKGLDENGNEVFETFTEVIQRVRNHQEHLWTRQLGRALNAEENAELDEWISLVLQHKVCCSGRTMWLADVDVANKREVAHFNCAATEASSINDIVDIFWLLLQGCGVGFSAKIGSLNGFSNTIKDIEFIEPKSEFDKGEQEYNTESFEEGVWTITVGDSAQAWAKAVGKLLAGKFKCKKLIIDLSNIRRAGMRLKGYGWISSGHIPFMEAIAGICKVMNARAGQLLRKIDIMDVCNWLGTTLSSRRAAEIFLFAYDEGEWRELACAKGKIFEDGNYQRYQSNNSLIFSKAPTREQLNEVFNLMAKSGGSEPGFINLEEAMIRAPWAKLTNPCLSGSAKLRIVVDGVEVEETFNNLVGKEDITVVALDGEHVGGCRVTYTGDKEIGFYELENGTIIECTPEHVFMTEDGDEDEMDSIAAEGRDLILYGEEGVNTSIKVKKVGGASRTPVYDFHMPHTHWGVVNGVITHNCAEILLPPQGGLCNLTETNVSKFDSEEELLRALYLSGRANYRQTLVRLKDEILQEKWDQNNKHLRLCGVGLTGIALREDLTAFQLKEMRNMAVLGAYSMAEELGTERPKNISCIKPSGSISKVFNCTEGLTKPLGKYIVNNINFGKHDPLLPKLREAGYTTFENPNDKTGVLVKFPVKWEGVTFDEVKTADGRTLHINTDSAVQQLDKYKMYMKHWCDQNASNTISYSPEEVPEIIEWLLNNWEYYVGVSFLYRADPTKTARDLGYAYLPQEVITQEEYEAEVAKIVEVDYTGTAGDMEIDAGGCSTGACPIK